MSVILGKHSYGNINVLRWGCADNVVVGKYCSVAAGCTVLLDGNHNIKSFSSFPFKEIFGWNECPKNNWGKKTPTIGNDVWIGNNVTIYSGADIGDGAAIAGNSIVTKSVPPYAVVAGNPARIIKYRFNPCQVQDLLRLKWWDLDESLIRHHLIPVIENMDEVIRRLKVLRGNKHV
jgi:acetyltransferase-like isoleucine patch superfamily enzyme